MKKSFLIRSQRKNENQLNAYMTVEASICFSMIIMLYFFLVSASLLLLVRCLASQNDYIIGLRGARFTYAQDAYGEIIYSEKSKTDMTGYMLSRLDMAGKMYPMYPQSERYAEISGEYVRINTFGGGKIGKNICSKEIRIINPIDEIRRKRG